MIDYKITQLNSALLVNEIYLVHKILQVKWNIKKKKIYQEASTVASWVW